MKPGRAILLTAAFLATCLGAGYAGYAATLEIMPERIMERTMDTIARAGERERWRHQGPVTGQSRAVVRPSPDLLYSACVFDLSDGPVAITATPSPIDGYWSLSLFDARTDNFFTRNDLDAAAGPIRIVLAAADAETSRCEGEIVRSPTDRGIAVIRRLAPTQSDKAAIMAAREQDACRPLTPDSCQPTDPQPQQDTAR